MLKMTKLISLSILLLIVTVLPAAAQVATLAWDQNSEPDVVGYYLYYRTDTASFPFNGTTLPEGTSPIYIDGVANTMIDVTLPNDGSIYYFAATAVTATDLESGYSEIAASEWVPFLLAPSDSAAVPTAATFSWDLAPAGYNVTYELHYGTDPNLAQNAALLPPTGGNGWLQPNLLLAIPLALLLTLLSVRMLPRLRGLWNPVRIGICIGIFAMQAACGGGGGADYSSLPGSVDPAPAMPVAEAVTVVAGIYDTSHQVSDLAPGTKYYWKVVAVDETGYPYESPIKSFTTLAN